MIQTHKSLNCLGNLIDLSTPCVMGILNVTPDSFHDGGKYTLERKWLAHAGNMLEAGASFIDIGGYSSRPNAEHISIEEELDRVIPVVKSLITHFPGVLISIDSFRSEVVRTALDLGASMINDISGCHADPKMLPLVAQYQVPVIMMHMKGTPQTMTAHASYENLVEEILFYFSEQIAAARSLGINDLIIDPGFGFAKTTEQNFELLDQLGLFQTLEVPVLVGVSRKSMIYKSLGGSPNEALNGTTALHMSALERGASILRVHDVKEAMECIALYEQLKKVAKHNLA
ncbi:MAG: dihydropteroate synthase [Flavobacteriaceae bacterium]|nr:dihydropteroate synthase [Flavobacteriaceae bacterium]MDH3796501.1 dihydropteroate synthase [Flavobacteriaceae bacterium]